MRDMPSVKQVKQIYIHSFLELIDIPEIDTPEKEEEFSIKLKNLYSNHSGVLMQMAKGAFELREELQNGNLVTESLPLLKKDKRKKHRSKTNGSMEFDELQETHEFLDRF